MDKKYLRATYDRGASMSEIAVEIGCSVHKVQYWMDKYKIERRDISDAIYRKHNPKGDPFKQKQIKTLNDAKLYGLGMGLYWGEGTKSNKYSVRLGNTDPALINAFIDFLVKLYGVHKDDFRFGLQIFTDINPDLALQFWSNSLNVSREQFHKPTITISGSIGTYRKKSLYGVVTVIYHNKKLRDLLVSALPT